VPARLTAKVPFMRVGKLGGLELEGWTHNYGYLMGSNFPFHCADRGNKLV
jgi:hypothetical protein